MTAENMILVLISVMFVVIVPLIFLLIVSAYFEGWKEYQAHKARKEKVRREGVL